MNITSDGFVLRARDLWLISFISSGLIFVGLLTNIAFYSIFGEGVIAIFYGFVGFLLDVSKITVVLLFSVFAFNLHSNYKEVIVCVVLWVLLSSFSYLAGYGVMLNSMESYEGKRLKGSMVYKQHVQQVEELGNQIVKYARYSAIDMLGIRSKMDTLEATLGSLSVKLNACPDRWFKNCINPLKAQIEPVKAQLKLLDSEVQGAKILIGLKQEKKLAESALANLGPQSVQEHHPLFVMIAKMRDTTPYLVKGHLTLILSLVLELLGTTLLYLKNRLLQQKYIRVLQDDGDVVEYATVNFKQEEKQYSHQNTQLGNESIQPRIQKDTQLDINESTDVDKEDTQLRNKHTQIAVRKDTQHSRKMDLWYTQILQDIDTGKLTSLSFRTLQSEYNLNQRQAVIIRMRLVDDGFAVMSRKNELTIV
jgi:hypothetical protein